MRDAPRLISWSTSPLADSLQAAFRDCCDMDASLGKRLDAFAASIRAMSAPFAEAVDRLIARLQKSAVGAGAPQVGDLFPPFHLPDETGRIVRLDELLRKSPVGIVIHRGHWCPYCRINTRALAQAWPRIEAVGGQVVAIVPDRQRYAAAIRAEAQAAFPILTDIDNGFALSLNLVFWVGSKMRELMSAAGLDLAAYQGNESWIVPVPATFVVSEEGRVKARFVDPDYRERMTIESMLGRFRADRQLAASDQLQRAAGL
jgi:peroxiredoxin